jgi:hypothetical protein
MLVTTGDMVVEKACLIVTQLIIPWRGRCAGRDGALSIRHSPRDSAMAFGLSRTALRDCAYPCWRWNSGAIVEIPPCAQDSQLQHPRSPGKQLLRLNDEPFQVLQGVGVPARRGTYRVTCRIGQLPFGKRHEQLKPNQLASQSLSKAWLANYGGQINEEV